jgi:hypothetical protein
MGHLVRKTPYFSTMTWVEDGTFMGTRWNLYGVNRNLYGAPHTSLPLHRLEKLAVRLRVLHLVEQELDGGELIHGVQELAQYPHLG